MWSQRWLRHRVITSTLQAKLGMWTLSPRKSAEEIVYNCTCFYSKENQRPSNEKQERMILAYIFLSVDAPLCPEALGCRLGLALAPRSQTLSLWWAFGSPKSPSADGSPHSIENRHSGTGILATLPLCLVVISKTTESISQK